MIDECSTKALPGLSAQLGDIERADLGREQYDTALARFALMHVRALDATLKRIALSLNNNGTLVAVTNVIEGTATVLTAFLEATSRVMKLVLRLKGHPIPVLNYARTQEEYVTAFQQAGLTIEFSETYEPKILHFEHEHPGVTLSHFVLVGKK
jgi:hypothetical protein